MCFQADHSVECGVRAILDYVGGDPLSLLRRFSNLFSGSKEEGAA
jgi:hypothetical protein